MRLTEWAEDDERQFGIVKHEMANYELGEYVFDDIHVNTLEGFFSIFKRGMRGLSALWRRPTNGKITKVDNAAIASKLPRPPQSTISPRT